jgi:hypothetical protein
MKAYGLKSEDEEEEEDEEEYDMTLYKEELGRLNNQKKQRIQELLVKFRSGTISLPDQLKQRIKVALKGMPKSVLREEAVKLSNTLRARTTSPNRHQVRFGFSITKIYQDLQAQLDPFKTGKFNPFGKVINQKNDEAPPKMKERAEAAASYVPPPPVYNDAQAMAYVVHRMPGVYACTHRVYSEVTIITHHVSYYSSTKQ